MPPRSNRRPPGLRPARLVLLLLLLLPPAVARAQIPDTFTNLKVLPRDIPRDSLVQLMRGFSAALGVRCQHCHASAEGRTDFASDEKVAKEKARFMMRMTNDLNQRVLPELPARTDPPVAVGCVTCHRASELPMTIDRVIGETIQREGIAAAIAQYRSLREESLSGRYDFGEDAIAELARRLGAAGRTADAIALLEMSAGYHPRSSAIDLQLGDLYRLRGEREQAIVRYRLALEKSPNNQTARRRLTELGATPPPR